MATTLLLDDWLDEHAAADVAETVTALAQAAGALSRRIAAGDLGAPAASTKHAASDGDVQKPLDTIADELVAEALRAAPVRWLASEEQAEAVELNPTGTLAVAVDPLDGSSNIDVNVSIGTIFGILPAGATAEAAFLRPGRAQVAAGYVVYGPQTTLALTLGDGVAVFLLDPATRAFRLQAERVRIPPTSSEFAINASNHRRWPPAVRAYVDDCLAGADGPRGKDFNMRWVASMVADCHRILMRGGVYLYPGDGRPGYERGRLRLLYECAPIAFLVEQAGGGATDGREPVLDQTPATLHARTPFVFGSIEKVERVAAYHDLPEREPSPLFRERGLFRDTSAPA